MRRRAGCSRPAYKGDARPEPGLAYVDTSAFVKVPLGEPERDALVSALAEYEPLSSAVLAVEAVRACARYGEGYAERARAGLSTVALLPIDDAVLAAAAGLAPASLRSLDALHLASALSVADDVAAFCCYDDRLASAATQHGFRIVAPARSSG